MSFIVQEKSLDSSSPQELYTITYDFNYWYYTSADEDYIDGPKTYQAVPIERSDLELKSDKTISSFEVTFPLDAQFIELFRVAPPSGKVTLLCQRFHRTDSGEEKAVFFKGHIVNVERGKESATVICESASQSLGRMGLRRHYQYACPYMMYSNECGVNRDLHKIAGTIAGVSGGVITSDALQGLNVKTLQGGYVEYTHSTLNTIERIMITSTDDVAGTALLFSAPVGLLVGQTVTFYKGCDRSLNTCHSTFNNVENYGGQPYIPVKNPFGSNPMY